MATKTDCMELFEFEEGEDYKCLCGKAYLTNKGRIVVYCNLCTLEFNGFQSYSLHLQRQHRNYTKPFQKEWAKQTIQKKGDINTNSLVIKIEPRYQVERLMEVGIPPSHLEENKESNEFIDIKKDIDDTHNAETSTIATISPANIKHETPPINEKTQNEKSTLETNKYLLEGIEIPTDIRHVQKHVYRRETELTKKYETEKRDYQCPICGTAFKDKSNLKHHIKRHSKEKQHQCTDCEKKFYTSSELKTHMHYHSSERDFLCSDCGQAFQRKAHLIRHSKRHSNQRDYKCPQCDMAFFDGSILARHLVSHSTDRPNACPQCNATFPYKTSLRNHMKIHENKREYKCLICGIGFNQKAGLFSHRKIVHKAS